MRRSGQWKVCLSGIAVTPAVNNQFYLDRQGHVSIFHGALGLIVTGANSKRQPELATFSEILNGNPMHMPVSSRLQMAATGDRLSLAYNTFFSDLYIAEPTEKSVTVRFVVSGKGTPAVNPRLTLQLRLLPGEVLETGAGKTVTVGTERLEFDAAALGGLIQHHGWTMKMDPSARLVWPVYPHNPYANQPETSLEHTVAALSVPLVLKAVPGKYVRAGEQEIIFTLSAQ